MSEDTTKSMSLDTTKSMKRRDFLKLGGMALAALAASAALTKPAEAVANDQLWGEICIFPYTFAPKDWAECAGQLIPIQQNTALFSLLGTMYGGDGQTNFALPDLRSADHAGYHAGLEFTPLRYYISLNGVYPVRP